MEFVAGGHRWRSARVTISLLLYSCYKIIIRSPVNMTVPRDVLMISYANLSYYAVCTVVSVVLQLYKCV